MILNPMHEKDSSLPDIPEYENALNEQVGGNHYKTEYQPIELMEKVGMYATCSYILKYIFRYEQKNGRQDLDKALHCCDLLEQLGCHWYLGNGGYHDNEEFYEFIKKNKQLNSNQVRAILAICNKDKKELKQQIHILISKYS